MPLAFWLFLSESFLLAYFSARGEHRASLGGNPAAVVGLPFGQA